jgi:integrase
VKARNLEIDRIVRIAGQPVRIRRTVGSTRPDVKRRMEAIIDKLMELGQTDIVAAFADEKIDASDLLHMDRSGPLATLADIRLNRPLYITGRTLIKKMRNRKTAKRYDTSLTRLQKKAKGELSARSVLRDLDSCDWLRVQDAWFEPETVIRGTSREEKREEQRIASPSDWMHMRRMVSRILTLTLGSEHHPFRLGVMAKIPAMKERQRTPKMTPAEFEKAVRHVREDVQDTIIALVGTGLRLGEFLALRMTHIDRATCSIQVPGTKTEGSNRGLTINPQLFRYVERAVFRQRLGESGIRKQWLLALKRADVAHISLHDLRHLYAQWAIDMGVPDSRVQDSLGHTNSAMTRRYTRKAGTVQASDALALVLFSKPKTVRGEVRGHSKHKAAR